MNAAQVAQDGDGGDVLPVEGKHAAAHGARFAAVFVLGLSLGLFHMSSVAVQSIVLQVVGGGDLGEQSSNHLDDVADRHAADLIAHLVQGRVVQDARSVGRQHVVSR